MKILLFGQSGQVAQELHRAATARGIDLVALSRAEADLTDPAACAAHIAQTDADVVINAAAYTAVDKAEEDADTALAVNGTTPGAMARAAAARNIPFLHISTDYVFDGSGDAPWAEDQATAPLGVYGHTKLAGEQAVIAAAGPHVILRTAWVFSAHGANFVKTMLRVGKDRDALTVVADQYGGPTPAADIAAALLSIADQFHAGQGISGVFHFSGAPSASWADFAEIIFKTSSLPTKPQINRIPSSDYPTPAKRPGNSRLECSKIKSVYGISQPDWQDGLGKVISELETSA